MISFYYGEQNHGKLKKLIRMSLKIISVIAAVTLIASLVVTEPLVSVFARPDNPVSVPLPLSLSALMFLPAECLRRYPTG